MVAGLTRMTWRRRTGCWIDEDDVDGQHGKRLLDNNRALPHVAPRTSTRS